METIIFIIVVSSISAQNNKEAVGSQGEGEPT